MPTPNEAYNLLHREMSGMANRPPRPGTNLADAYVRAACTFLTSSQSSLGLCFPAKHIKSHPLDQLGEHATLLEGTAAHLEALIAAAVTCLLQLSWSPQPGVLPRALAEALRWADALEMADSADRARLLRTLVDHAARTMTSQDDLSSCMLVLHQHSGRSASVLQRAFGLLAAERSATDEALAHALYESRSALLSTELPYGVSLDGRPLTVRDVRKSLEAEVNQRPVPPMSLTAHSICMQSLEQLEAWPGEARPLEQALPELSWLFSAAYGLASIKQQMVWWQTSLGKAGVGKDFRGWFGAVDIMSQYVDCSDCASAAMAWLQSADRTSAELNPFDGKFPISLKWIEVDDFQGELDVTRLRFSAMVRENDLDDALRHETDELLDYVGEAGEGAAACLVQAIERLIHCEANGIPCLSRGLDGWDESDFYISETSDDFLLCLDFLIERFGETKSLERILDAAGGGDDARELIAQAIVESERFDFSTVENAELLEAWSKSGLAQGVLRLATERRAQEQEDAEE